MKLTIVYDNEVFRKDVVGLKSGWGFSCVIEPDEGGLVLFDTGWEGTVLVDNMDKLGFDIGKVDTVILSHPHWDHVGGLPYVMNRGRDFKVFLPESFSENMKEEIRRRYNVTEVSGTQGITDSIYSTGELGGRTKEQAIIIETKKGLMVVTGCAHPGLDAIIEKASGYGRIYGILGGFHGFRNFKALEEMELIVPCHCTQYKKEIKELFRDKVSYGGVGYMLEL